MTRTLVVTVAGMATRFSRSVGRECVKCLYRRGDFSTCLLSRLLRQPVSFDRYVLVGGYRFAELADAVRREFPDLADRLTLVNNLSYARYGSGWSLYCGLREACGEPFDELVFAEGDLYLDPPSFSAVCEAPSDVLTYNREPILADRSVVFYFDLRGRVHYRFDIGHGALRIDEPFTEIRNSGQVWKFADPDRLRTLVREMPESDWQGTNLTLIERYFGGEDRENYRVLPFADWINCNTVSDFDRIPKNREEST